MVDLCKTLGLDRKLGIAPSVSPDKACNKPLVLAPGCYVWFGGAPMSMVTHATHVKVRDFLAAEPDELDS